MSDFKMSFTPYDPRSHYWIVGASTAAVYSSRSNTMVAVSDADYVVWGQSRTATPIQDEAELTAVLRSAGVLPEWLFNAPSCIQPAVGIYDSQQLHAYADFIFAQRVAAVANVEARLRALELHAQGDTAAADALFASIDALYKTLTAVMTDIDSGALTQLDQVDAAMG